MPPSTARPPRPISIGALSQATGLPVETIRTWERRYGFPSPERTPSGHRRYALETVERLLLVTKALTRGHRPSAVVDAEPEVLRRLLELPDASAADDRFAPLSDTLARDLRDPPR